MNSLDFIFLSFYSCESFSHVVHVILAHDLNIGSSNRTDFIDTPCCVGANSFYWCDCLFDRFASFFFVFVFNDNGYLRISVTNCHVVLKRKTVLSSSCYCQTELRNCSRLLANGVTAKTVIHGHLHDLLLLVIFSRRYHFWSLDMQKVVWYHYSTTLAAPRSHTCFPSYQTLSQII